MYTDVSADKLWKVPREAFGSALSGHHGRVTCLTWSGSDKYLVSASVDQTVRVWDAQNTAALLVFQLPDVWQLIGSPHHRFVICGCWDKIVIFDLESGRVVLGLDEAIYTAAFFSPGSSFLISSRNVERGGMRRADIQTLIDRRKQPENKESTPAGKDLVEVSSPSGPQVSHSFDWPVTTLTHLVLAAHKFLGDLIRRAFGRFGIDRKL